MEQSPPIVVTGANDGIGKAIALELAKRGRHVVLVCRNMEKGERALAELQAQVQGAKLGLVHGDLSSLRQTHDLADALLEGYPTLAGLINNAGVWMSSRQQNEEGLETTFMVNHMAPFVLSRRLFGALKAHGEARIVNVNAGLYAKGHFAPDQTPSGEDFHPLWTYAHSKLWGVLCTVEMARRTEGHGVDICAVHPGVIRTNLGHRRGPLGWLMRGIKLLWASPQRGAEAPVWLATSKEACHGAYFNEMKREELAENARVPGRAEECWDSSEALAANACSRCAVGWEPH